MTLQNYAAYALYVVERMEISVSNVRHLKDHLSHSSQRPDTTEDVCEVVGHYQSYLSELLVCLELLAVKWEEYVDRVQSIDVSQVYCAPMESSGASRRGRPRLEVTQDQLEYLSSLSFSWTEIAALLGVSRMTLYGRRREYRMLQVNPSRMLTDDQLRWTLAEMRQEHPEFGETMGHLRALGYHITRQRLRMGVHMTDPINTALRWRGGLTIRRPYYSVPGPNSLWQIGQ